MIEFDTKLTAKDMYRFNMYQTYSGIHGWVSVFAAIFLWVIAARNYDSVTTNYTIFCVVFGLVFLFYFPITLYLHSKHAIAASKVLSSTLHYEVGEEGIRVSQGEESAELKWQQIYRMVATKHNVLVYSNRVNAYVIPREQLGEAYTPLAEIANAKLEKHRVKMC